MPITLGEIKDRPELTRLIREAVEKYNRMTPEKREAMRDAQVKSYVRGEMGWPRDCPYR